MPNESFAMKLDLFPESYNGGMSVQQVHDMLKKVTALNPEDSILMIQDGELKVVKIGVLQEALGGGGGGGSIVDNNTYLTIKDE